MAEHNVTKDPQFRQIWTERPDGVFDGPYTVYWGSGPVICMRGRYAAGAQECVWSYWDRTGKLDKQIRFHNDEPIETRTAPPWLDDAADQHPIDTDTLSSSATPGST